jgi:cytochrome c oxidase cbb3-type subunit II
MNRAVWLYLGVLITVIASFVGLVQIPDHQLRGLQPIKDDLGVERPGRPDGGVLAGRAEYIGLGCLYCHSQQVRPEGFGADLARGWGVRRTVARDYLWDVPPVMGTMRTGPDLANIGARQPSVAWHLEHLYKPRLTSPGSTMPEYPFLFAWQRVELQRPADALSFPQGEPRPGWVVVPTQRARDLVTYLGSLDHSYAVPEAR